MSREAGGAADMQCNVAVKVKDMGGRGGSHRQCQ